MTQTTHLSPTVAQQQQLYLQRVNQLYRNIQDWLREKPLTLTTQDLEIEEVLGCYHVPKLEITPQTGETLAEFHNLKGLP